MSEVRVVKQKNKYWRAQQRQHQCDRRARTHKCKCILTQEASSSCSSKDVVEIPFDSPEEEDQGCDR